MKTVNYLILSLVLAPCASIFGAEVTESEAKRQAAIRAMHSARNEQELKVALAAGAKVRDPLIEGNPDSYCQYTSLLCSVVLNPKAHDDLIPTVASMGGLVEWGTMKVVKNENGERRDITPIFLVLKHRVGSDCQQNSLDLLQRKCVRLVDVGCPLASCWRWITKPHDARCPVQMHACTFADRVMPELSSMSRIIEVPFLYKGRFMRTLAMCKAMHDAVVKRETGLRKAELPDALPRFSLDLVGVVGSYVQAEEPAEITKEAAEIAKLHAFITNHQVLPYLSELEQYLSELEQETKAKVEMASAS